MPDITRATPAQTLKTGNRFEKERIPKTNGALNIPKVPRQGDAEAITQAAKALGIQLTGQAGLSWEAAHAKVVQEIQARYAGEKGAR